MGLQVAGRVLSGWMVVLALGAAGSPIPSASAQGTATSGWSTEASRQDGQAQQTVSPVLCQSFEKGVFERISSMRRLRFGGAKAPPLMPSTVDDWKKTSQMDPDAARRYAEEEAMVKRLNGYMVANGCKPVDVEAELRKGAVKAEKKR